MKQNIPESVLNELLSDSGHILEQIKSDAGLMNQWKIYQRKYDFAMDYNWEDMVKNVEQLLKILPDSRKYTTIKV